MAVGGNYNVPVNMTFLPMQRNVITNNRLQRAWSYGMHNPNCPIGPGSSFDLIIGRGDLWRGSYYVNIYKRPNRMHIMPLIWIIFRFRSMDISYIIRMQLVCWAVYLGGAINIYRLLAIFRFNL